MHSVLTHGASNRVVYNPRLQVKRLRTHTVRSTNSTNSSSCNNSKHEATQANNVNASNSVSYFPFTVNSTNETFMNIVHLFSYYKTPLALNFLPQIDYWQQCVLSEAIYRLCEILPDNKVSSKLCHVLTNVFNKNKALQIAKKVVGQGQGIAGDDFFWQALLFNKQGYSDYKSYTTLVYQNSSIKKSPCPPLGSYPPVYTEYTPKTPYFNSITNQIAILSTSYLGDTIDLPDDLSNWFMTYMVGSDGIVPDGLIQQTCNKFMPAYTYTSGPILMALYRTYKLTGKEQYLTLSMQICNYSMTHFQENNICHEFLQMTAANHVLFKGIYMRYLAEYVYELKQISNPTGDVQNIIVGASSFITDTFNACNANAYLNDKNYKVFGPDFAVKPQTINFGHIDKSSSEWGTSATILSWISGILVCLANDIINIKQ